jgi:hypothetical protein
MKRIAKFFLPLLLSLILCSSQQPVSGLPKFPRRTPGVEHIDDGAGIPRTSHFPDGESTNIPSSVLRIFNHKTPRSKNNLYLSRNSNNLFELVRSDGTISVIDTSRMSLQLHLTSAIALLDGQANLFIPEDIFFQNHSVFSQLEEIKELYIIRPNDSLHTTKRIKTANGWERVIEVHPGLNFAVKSSSELNNVFWLMEKKLNKDDLRFISLFDSDDIDIVNNIDKVSGEFHIPSTQLQKQSLDSSFKKLSNKIVFIIGHIEDDAFVVRKADNSIAAKFDVADLEEVAQRHRVTLVLLGCQTAKVSRASGFVTPIRDTIIAQGITDALRAKNYGQMLSSFARAETPFIARAEVANQVKLNVDLSFEQDRRAATAQAFTITSVRISTVSRVGAARIFLFLPAWIHQFYLGLMTLSIFSFRGAWRKFKGKWLLVPKFRINSFKSLSHHTTRVISFILLLPIYNLFLMISKAPFLLWLAFALLFDPLFLFFVIAGYFINFIKNGKKKSQT